MAVLIVQQPTQFLLGKDLVSFLLETAVHVLEIMSFLSGMC